MAERERGPVEIAYGGWVAELGQLSPLQAAKAAQVMLLARNLDKADGSDAPLAAVASVSRQLTKAADELRSARSGGMPAVSKPVDGVDEVGAKRTERRRAAAAGQGAT